MKTALLIAMAAVLPVGLVACSEYNRKLPPTELPQRPASATLPCEAATDLEIQECIANPKSRDLCRKLDTNCARYKNLQQFVERTWSAKDGK